MATPPQKPVARGAAAVAPSTVLAGIAAVITRFRDL